MEEKGRLQPSPPPDGVTLICGSRWVEFRSFDDTRAARNHLRLRTLLYFIWAPASIRFRRFLVHQLSTLSELLYAFLLTVDLGTGARVEGDSSTWQWKGRMEGMAA